MVQKTGSKHVKNPNVALLWLAQGCSLFLWKFIFDMVRSTIFSLSAVRTITTQQRQHTQSSPINLTSVTVSLIYGAPMAPQKWQSLKITVEIHPLISSWSQLPLFSSLASVGSFVSFEDFNFGPADFYKFLLKISYKGIRVVFLQNRNCKAISILDT